VCAFFFLFSLMINDGKRSEVPSLFEVDCFLRLYFFYPVVKLVDLNRLGIAWWLTRHSLVLSLTLALSLALFLTFISSFETQKEEKNFKHRKYSGIYSQIFVFSDELWRLSHLEVRFAVKGGGEGTIVEGTGDAVCPFVWRHSLNAVLRLIWWQFPSQLVG